ncbi:hypothetical protein Mgra_00001006, partial [Meloidogyne graminicola]
MHSFSPLTNFSEFANASWSPLEFRTPSPPLPMRVSTSTPTRRVIATPRSIFGTDLSVEYRKLTEKDPIFSSKVCLICQQDEQAVQ